jgi:hypothetical protein
VSGLVINALSEKWRLVLDLSGHTYQAGQGTDIGAHRFAYGSNGSAPRGTEVLTSWIDSPLTHQARPLNARSLTANPVSAGARHRA